MGVLQVCHLNNAKADVGEVMKKVKVNGDDAEPLFKYLKYKQSGTLGLSVIKWNFAKFLIDKNGQPVDRFAPTTSPIDISEKIEKLLKE